MSCTDQYYLDRTLHHADGGITRVWRPDLDDEERARRMRRAEASAMALLKEVMKHEKV